MFIKVILACILGGMIGYEREISHKPAGLRTHILLCLGACLLTFLSLSFKGIAYADITRIASNIMVGIGFIGAGVIMNNKDTVEGITTAATIWFTSIIGMLIGFGSYILAGTSTIVAILVLEILAKLFKEKSSHE